MARSSWYPTLAAIIDASYNQSLLPFGGEVNIQKDRIAHLGVGLELTWTLLDFGRREAMADPPPPSTRHTCASAVLNRSHCPPPAFGP